MSQFSSAHGSTPSDQTNNSWISSNERPRLYEAAQYSPAQGYTHHEQAANEFLGASEGELLSGITDTSDLDLCDLELMQTTVGSPGSPSASLIDDFQDIMRDIDISPEPFQ